jgi:hypothetical protein
VAEASAPAGSPSTSGGGRRRGQSTEEAERQQQVVDWQPTDLKPLLSLGLCRGSPSQGGLGRQGFHDIVCGEKKALYRYYKRIVPRCNFSILVLLKTIFTDRP